MFAVLVAWSAANCSAGPRFFFHSAGQWHDMLWMDGGRKVHVCVYVCLCLCLCEDKSITASHSVRMNQAEICSWRTV